MVMHARKPQRISDGYFEKHQTHPYQKYNSKRAANEYISSDNRYTPLRSPNGNVPHGHAHGLHAPHSAHSAHSAHSHHHYTHMVVDERGYPTSRNSYMQKVSDKERDRDYKSSRNKYTDVRSPKEKRSKDSEREKNNHERCESEKKNRTSSINSSVNRSGKYDKRNAPSSSAPCTSEWSEHISSSGKKYYYNCISEVSQWEKPREWDSRRNSSKDSTYSSRNNRDKRSSSRSGRRESEKPSKRTNSTSERYWSGREEEGHERPRPKHLPPGHDGKEVVSNRANSTSERYWSGRGEEGPERPRPKYLPPGHERKDGQTQDMDISPDRSTPLSENSYGAREATRPPAENTVPPVVVLDNSNQTTGSLLAAALPRIVGPPAVCLPANNGGASPEAGSGAGTPQRDAGPPTPTHSENMDPHAPPLHLENALPRKMECLGSYSSVVGSATHTTPMLTPTLMNYARADLANHVAGWPADILDKQANKFTEEAYQLGCLQCTRVSAELKCSRSLVRHTEIQATLQEQKIMYLRQQISRLEELKSQNSFMSDD